MTERERFDVAVIGGGRAGLATGYHPAQREFEFAILDAGERIGESWRRRRRVPMGSSLTIRGTDRTSWTARMLSAVAAVMLWISGIGVAPAQAHRLDRVTPNRAGPIVRGETTMRELREWFGDPTRRKTVRLGCERVISAGWDGRVRVYVTRERPRTVAAIFVRARSIASAEHGDLTMHTGRGLRVGNSESRLRRLYPRSEPETHAGHTHYRLRTDADGPYLMAKVVDGGVVQLEVWPYEFC